MDALGVPVDDISNKREPGMHKVSVQKVEERLNSFHKSPKTLDVVYTVLHNEPAKPPETICVLDSSFNPPTIAHMSLAVSGLLSLGRERLVSTRLLLLFSTNGFEAAPSPASFASRVQMMALMAEDLHVMYPELSEVPVDIGITTQRLQLGKSQALGTMCLEKSWPGIRQIHLVGFDNLVRVLDPKWYPSNDRPLGALGSFFDNDCEFHCMMRLTQDDTGCKKEGEVAL